METAHVHDEIIVYTDGGCSGNPGPGGWGTVILADGRELRKSGGEPNTTNNRMELTAVLSALDTIFAADTWKGRPVAVYIDSQYVKNGITQWMPKWKQNGWHTADRKPVKNQDLWVSLDTFVSQMKITWNWVKGHAGIRYNEICDTLAGNEIKKLK